MADNGLRDLYLDELRDLHNAENQLVKALPKMAKASSSDELREGFEQHLEQTKGHVERLEQIFEALDESPKGTKCVGMEGLIKEGSEIMDEDFEGAVMDAALIGAAQRVEHYEIAAYGTVIAFANQLGESEHASLLKQTLEEEKETDQKLTSLSDDINSLASSESEGAGSEEEEVMEPESRSVSRPAKKKGRGPSRRAA
jgi:ferritin-like metal-binding protein YciE